MRRFQTLLLVAGLAAAPTSAAFAGPGNGHHDETSSVDTYEWSMGKGRLGLMLMGLTPELRQYLGASSTSGVIVARVEADSPAAKAGVRVGDVLTKANDHAVDDAGDVINAMSTLKKGDAVTLGIIRDHKPVSIKVVLADDAPPMPNLESFWMKDWFHDFMKSFDDMKQPSHSSSKT